MRKESDRGELDDLFVGVGWDRGWWEDVLGVGWMGGWWGMLGNGGVVDGGGVL